MIVPFLPSCQWYEFHLLLTLTNTDTVKWSVFLNFSRFGGYIAVSHCGIILHFPNKQWCWTSSSVLICRPFTFIGEMSIQIFCPYFSWVSEVLYIFWIQILRQIHTLQRFSFSLPVVCLFILIMSFKAVLNFDEIQYQFFHGLFFQCCSQGIFDCHKIFVYIFF